MPFTESYIALCREHPMEQEWMPGDFARVTDNLAGTEKTVAVGSLPAWWEASPDLYGAFWLPRLDQLLDLLETAGVTMVGLERAGKGYECRDMAYLDEGPIGTSREEAAYRLLLVVRGVTPATPP